MIKFLTVILLCTASWLVQSESQSICPCKIGKGKFRDCREKDPDEVWRVHYDTEVGLYDDCLPRVKENTMKCFRWRIADECGPKKTLKCALRHRVQLDGTLFPLDSLTRSVMIASPGFNRSSPHGAYFNRNLCIYNISLNCSQEMVELEPNIIQTTSLSDAEDCLDYLSFHVPSRREPVMKQLVVKRSWIQWLTAPSFLLTSMQFCGVTTTSMIWASIKSKPAAKQQSKNQHPNQHLNQHRRQHWNQHQNQHQSQHRKQHRSHQNQHRSHQNQHQNQHQLIILVMYQ